MILDGERAIREALAAAENDPARHGHRVPESILDAARGLANAPPPSDAVLHAVRAIATRDAAALSVAVHTNHGRLGAGLVRAAVAALQLMDSPSAALECSAFARYELGLPDVPAALPADFDFGAWGAGARRDANAHVTGAGYARGSAAAPPNAAAAGQPAGYLAERPWLMQAVLEQSPDSRAVVDGWWRLVVPALLNFLDTADLHARARGVRLVAALAQRFGARLRYAGLVPVFEDAVEPCLSFLPPLESAERTKLVFAPAVQCLGALAELAPDAGARVARLNYVARDGCLKAFLHTYENVELTAYFFDTLREFVDTHAQSLTAVHLSGIVRMFTQVMTDPFIDASPPLVDAACRAMAAAIRWAWPRIDAYKYSILLGLTKANALDTECLELLQVSEAEKSQLTCKANELALQQSN